VARAAAKVATAAALETEAAEQVAEAAAALVA